MIIIAQNPVFKHRKVWYSLFFTTFRCKRKKAERFTVPPYPTNYDAFFSVFLLLNHIATQISAAKAETTAPAKPSGLL